MRTRNAETAYYLDGRTYYFDDRIAYASGLSEVVARY